MLDLAALIVSCAPLVAPATAFALIDVESSGNAHAIGVVNGRLQRQPASRNQALRTAQQLDAGGWDYSVGLAQINRRNFARLGLDTAAAFEPCNNVRAMQEILAECFARASGRQSEQQALRMALSCYYTGNFARGFKDGYVQRVVLAAAFRQRKELLSSCPLCPK